MKKKKVIFESVFVLLLVLIGAYLIFAKVPDTQSSAINPLNNTNLSSKVTFGLETIFSHNFTCNTTIGSGAAGPGGGLVTGNLSLVGDFNGTFSVNKTNSSDVYAGNVSGFTLNATSDGTYTWQCRTNYNANVTILRTANNTVTIDLTVPTISNVANATASGTGPGGTWVSNNTEVNIGNESRIQTKWAIVASVSDTGSLVKNCSLYHNFGTEGEFIFNVTNNTAEVYQNNGSLLTFYDIPGTTYFNLSPNATGYKYNIGCTDHANNTKHSGNVTLFVDGILPNGSINTPQSVATNYSSWSDETLNISAIATDVGNSTISNCSLYGDFNGTWNRNQTVNVSGLDNVSFDFTLLTLDTNKTGYKYNVLCKDRANNRQNLSVGERLVTIDAHAPGVALTSSAGTSLGLGGSTTLTCDGTDDIETASMEITVDDGTSVCSSVASCSGTYTMAGSGAKTAKCKVDDQVGHSIETTLSLSYAGGDGGSSSAGGGGTSGGTTSTTVTTTPTTVVSVSGAGETIPLVIKGESYSLGIDSVTSTSTSVSLADQTLDLGIGETRNVDVDNDGVNDAEITLDSITDNKPQFTIREIRIETEAGITEEGVGEEISRLPSKSLIGLGVLILAIIVALIIYLVERRK